jgi:hypothetical protein
MRLSSYPAEDKPVPADHNAIPGGTPDWRAFCGSNTARNAFLQEFRYKA